MNYTNIRVRTWHLWKFRQLQMNEKKQEMKRKEKLCIFLYVLAQSIKL